MSRPLEIIPIEQPYDEYERLLLSQIDELRRDYEERVKPFVAALVQSRRLKPPTYLIDPASIDPAALQRMQEQVK